MSANVKCPSCGREVVPMAVGNKNFCPECESEILPVTQEEPVSETAVKPSSAPAAQPSSASGAGHSIADGMGMIEENRTKIGAVETFSDNSVTNHNHTTNTTNISNVTKIEDDTKRSVVCEISGRKVLVTSSVVCPVCGKTVAEQYYDEAKLRCTACEKKAVEAYEKFYKEMVTGSRVIDNELRSVLDGKASSLKLTEEQMKEIEIKLRRKVSDKQDRLTEIQQKDFDRTTKQLKDGKITVSSCLNKVSAYAKLTEEETVQCWYRLLSAVSAPENYLKDLKTATVDDFWQIYWGFVAAFMTKNATEAVLCVDSAKSKYPDRINDVTLAQACMEYLQYMDTKDESCLADARNDISCAVETEARCLQEFRERLKNVISGKDGEPAGIEKLLFARPASAPARPAAPAAPSASAAPSAQPSKPTQQTAAPAGTSQATKEAPSTKGYTLNSAGGPLNPTVTSFTQVQESKPKKKKTGLWIALVAVAAVAGIYFLGTGDQAEEPSAPAASATVSEKPAAAPEAKVEPAPVEAAPVKEAEPVKETAPVAAEPAKQPTMAEKAAQATTAPAAGPQDESLKQGLEAYEKGDYKLAHDLFKRAATAGNAEACYQLGLMLSTGKGSVAKNPLQGKVWIKKAAGLGHAEAAKALETN